MEAALEEGAVGDAGAHTIHVVDAPDRPWMHRWVEVRELPLVRGDLPVRMLELLEQHQPELLLGKVGVDDRDRHRVERQIPRRKPRIFPFIRHRQHAHRIEVPPVLVADLVTRVGRWRIGVVTLQPQVDVEDIVLLGPHHAGEGLALDAALVFRSALRMDRLVELVRLATRTGDDRVHPRSGGPGIVRQAEVEDHRATGWHVAAVVDARLGAVVAGVRGRRFAVDDMAVEGVLVVAAAVLGRDAVEALDIRLVVGEQGRAIGIGREVALAERILERQIGQPVGLRVVGDELQLLAALGIELDLRRTLTVLAPAPDVAEPELRDQVDLGIFRTTVADLDTDAEVLRPFLRVLDEDVEIAVLIEDAGIEQLELGTTAVAAAVLSHQPLVRVLRLRVLVQVLHVAVGRSAIDVEVVLLQVFAMVALGRDQPERAFLQDRVSTVPQRQRKAQQLVLIRDAGQAVFAPAVGLAAGHVVREIVPRCAVAAVVLADRSPGPLAEVRPPSVPRLTPAGFLQPIMLGRANLFDHSAPSSAASGRETGPLTRSFFSKRPLPSDAPEWIRSGLKTSQIG